MKYILLVALALAAFGAKAQDNYDKEALRKLALIVVDLKEEHQNRNITASISVTPDKKEEFKNAIDAGLEVYVIAVEEYYKSHYTPAEIVQLIAFYETSAGKKLAQDTQRLISGEFPKGKEWDMQLYELGKEDPRDKKQ